MRTDYTLFISDDVWHVASAGDGELRTLPVPFGDAVTLEARAQATRAALSAAGWTDQPVVMALGSPWCLSASISTDGLERGGRRRAMAFRIEEHLPISSEEVVVDYCEGRGGHAMGVCGELARLKAVVDAFTGCGIRVRHICPAALLSAAGAAEQRAGLDGVLLGQAGDGAAGGVGYDLIELDGGKPARWWWLAGEDGALGDRLSAWAGSRDHPAQLALVGCNDRTRELATRIGGITCVEAKAADRYEAAAGQAPRILSDAAAPWIDLRRDALASPDRYQAYRRPVALLVGAAMLLLVCVSVVMQWRGRQYQALAQEYGQRQAETFRAAIPNQAPPGNVRGRLASEYRRLAGQIGQGVDGGKLSTTQPESTLTLLGKVLASVPTGSPCRIVDMNFQPGLIRIDGEVLTNALAGEFAKALHISTGYDVTEGDSHALKDGGFTFTLTAKPRADAARQKEGH